MPLRQEATFLRERARRLRAIAKAHRTALSEQLRALARELEARAEELEKGVPSAENGGLGSLPASTHRRHPVVFAGSAGASQDAPCRAGFARAAPNSGYGNRCLSMIGS